MEGEVEKLVHMEERLHQRVVGQDEAVEAVANALRRSRAGLQDPTARSAPSSSSAPPASARPSWRARSPSSCSTRRTRWSASTCPSTWRSTRSSRLVGAPPGYVGYDEGGQLTEAVRRRPYCVVLLDEIEKAHPDVFNVLLQVMDDGRLTDGQGRTVDFKNTVLIMTSNIPGGRVGAEGHFKPEFINRLDDIVEFDAARAASRSARSSTCRSSACCERVAERGITVELTDEARSCSATSATTRPTARGR